MPLYEYACRACGTRFERMRKYAERLDPSECPSCGAEQTSLALSTPGLVGAAASTTSTAEPCATDPGGCCGGACRMN